MTTQKVGQGGNITLDNIIRDGSGQLVDPTNLLVDIFDPDGNEIASDIGPMRDSLGRFHIIYTVGTTAVMGTWKANWAGDINAVAIENDDFFEVVEAGTFDFSLLDDFHYLCWLLDDWRIAGVKNFFTDDMIKALLHRHSNHIYRAAGDGWAIRTAFYAKQIDLEGSIRRGANPEYQRPYSQLWTHAKGMVEYYFRLAREVSPDPSGPGSPYPLVGKAINLRETPDWTLFTGEE